MCPPSATGQQYKKKAHIIPQGLGNRALQTWEECDDCNEHVGSPLEDHLTKSLALVRAICAVPSAATGYRRRPDAEAFVGNRVVDGERRVHIRLAEGDASIQVQRDERQRSVTYTAELQPHRPLDALRAIGRMGFLALPRAAATRHDHLRRWIRGEVEYLPTYTRMWVPGPAQKKSWLRVWEQKWVLVDYPAMVVEYFFGICGYFLYIPPATFRRPSITPLPLVTRSPYPPHDPVRYRLSVESDEMAVNTRESWTIGYTDAQERDLSAEEFERLFGVPPT